MEKPNTGGGGGGVRAANSLSNGGPKLKELAAASPSPRQRAGTWISSMDSE